MTAFDFLLLSGCQRGPSVSWTPVWCRFFLTYDLKPYLSLTDVDCSEIIWLVCKIWKRRKKTFRHHRILNHQVGIRYLPQLGPACKVDWFSWIDSYSHRMPHPSGWDPRSYCPCNTQNILYRKLEWFFWNSQAILYVIDFDFDPFFMLYMLVSIKPQELLDREHLSAGLSTLENSDWASSFQERQVAWYQLLQIWLKQAKKVSWTWLPLELNKLDSGRSMKRWR